MKQTIKLTETQLHSVIKKCVNEALNEIGNTHRGQNMLGRVASRALRNISYDPKNGAKYAETLGQAYNTAQNNNPIHDTLSKIEELLNDLWLHWGCDINVDEIMGKIRSNAEKKKWTPFKDGYSDENDGYEYDDPPRY